MLHHNYLKDVSITCFYGINFTNNIITKYDINGNKHCFGDESNNYTVHDDWQMLLVQNILIVIDNYCFYYNKTSDYTLQSICFKFIQLFTMKFYHE